MERAAEPDAAKCPPVRAGGWGRGNAPGPLVECLEVRSLLSTLATAGLVDVTRYASLTLSNTFLDNRKVTLQGMVTIRNTSNSYLAGTTYLVLTNIPSAGVATLHPDGETDTGLPFFEIEPATAGTNLEALGIAPGATSNPTSLTRKGLYSARLAGLALPGELHWKLLEAPRKGYGQVVLDATHVHVNEPMIVTANVQHWPGQTRIPTQVVQYQLDATGTSATAIGVMKPSRR
ncbi:MAG: hypothetical protein U0794_21425 [Isosphaeraceae bacterium]